MSYTHRFVNLPSLGHEKEEGRVDLPCLDIGRIGSGTAVVLTLPSLRFLIIA